ncbi:succinyl-diaminopimelate desuccinylase [Dehalogenimonas formicexedens]|uniref:Succinyl-diaminopimelate desuccinylase n=1 Tax=Dehalogenimonas formicexedens TaxID=1839801 RepID=A0A1P8F8E5_9CHLR|nr:M20/M25/M40 family metallo-hydrolase [Dehalogenimonas formicexedens]APV44703.1 succinyl-diaminopimelate desuccinylase [Dehalogenimonas formicexedens]
MDYVKTLSDLVAIDTTVPPGNNYRLALEYLVPHFEGAGFQSELVEIPTEFCEGRTGRFALISHRKSQAKPRLIFYGHIDVVPAQGWPAFEPRVENGKMFGRGSADMKGGIVGLLIGLNKMADREYKYDVSIMITTDEELSQSGQIRFLKRFLEPVAGSIVWSLDSNTGGVAIAGLGALQVDIKINGKSVHSGLSHLGTNAVEQAVPVMNALLELKSKITAKRSAVPAHPDTGLKFMEPRLNINMIHGGLKSNIVPDECTITVDRRLIPEETLEEADNEIRDLLGKFKDIRWEISYGLRVPTVPPANGPAVERLEKLIKEVTGTSGRFGEMGSGDMGIIVHEEWQGQDFGLGVIRTESNIHGKDEFVYLKDIEDLGEIISRYLSE